MTLTLDQLLERNTQAHRKSPLMLNSLRVELQIIEPEFTVDIIYHAQRPDLVHVNVQMESQIVFIESYNGEFAWQKLGDQVAEISSVEGTGALRRGAVGNLYLLADYPSLERQLTLLSPTEIENTSFYTVQVTHPDGHEEYKYIHPETFFVTRERDQRALHPDMDPTIRLTENRKFDFQEVDGLMWSFRSEKVDLGTNEVIQSTQIKKIALNSVIDPSILQMHG